jgi:GH18 family chitinase
MDIYKSRIIVIFLSVVLFTSCKDEKIELDNYLDRPVCAETFVPKGYDHQVIGFYPHYRHSILPITDISWEKITRVIYAFARPNADGSLNTSDLTGIAQLVEEGHGHGVEVYVSVGGGGDYSENLPLIAADKSATDKFIKEIRQYLFENCLDGVDIDWEHWSGTSTNTVNIEESRAFAEILRLLKNEIEPFGLGLSIDVSASNWGGRHILDDVEEYVDLVQVMAYDFSGPWSAPGPHSSFEDAIGSGSDISSTGLAYWMNYRKWSKVNIVLGVPFYGRDFDNAGGAGISYASILELYPDAWQFDQVGNIYYNGIPTIVQKAQYVKDQQYPGIMIWELGQDHPTDSLSLLNAIDQVLNPS